MGMTSQLCAYCERPAVIEADGEQLCQQHYNEWWHDNHFTCESCGKEGISFDDGVMGAEKDQWFCSAECCQENEEERRDWYAHVRFESHSSNFI